MSKPGEVHVDLSEEQWATVKAAVDGEIASLEAENGRLRDSIKATDKRLSAEIARLQERVEQLEKEQVHLLEMSREVLDQRDAAKLELAVSRRQGGNARRAIRRGRRQRDGWEALAKVRGEALDKKGCSYNLQHPCITSLKDYPAEWCLRCRAIAMTPEEALSSPGERE